MIVLIDAGHGKNTPGKRSPKLKNGKQLLEWEFNRDLAARIQKKLEAFKIKTVMLVTEKNDVSLDERCARANKYFDAGEPCILLSVHANAFGDGSAFTEPSGWEAFSSEGVTESDNITAKLYQAAEEVCGSMISIRTNGYSKEFPGKEENFKILTGTKMPAVLTENLFYTNEKECTAMFTEETREMLAELNFRGIFYYVNSSECKKYVSKFKK